MFCVNSCVNDVSIIILYLCRLKKKTPAFCKAEPALSKGKVLKGCVKNLIILDQS